MTLLARRYARALLEVAEAKGATDAVAADLARIHAALEEPVARAIVLDPRTPRPARQKALDRLASGGHPLTLSLLAALVRRRREALLRDLPAELQAALRQRRGELDGVVETAKEIDEGQLARLAEQARRLCGRKVHLRAVVKPELIGGVRIFVGNTLYDGSVATALEDLERRLMEVPVA